MAKHTAKPPDMSQEEWENYLNTRKEDRLEEAERMEAKKEYYGAGSEHHDPERESSLVATAIPLYKAEIERQKGASSKGGSHKHYDEALQTFIDILSMKAKKDNKNITLTNILSCVPVETYSGPSDSLDMHEFVHNEGFDAYAGNLADAFDNVFIEGKHLWWKNRKGEDSHIETRSLYPYLNRSKESCLSK